MTEIHNPPHAALDPFTYVKDSSDYIYYVREAVTSEEVAGYAAVCVYYPDELGDRVQASSGVTYSKFASQGLDFERPDVLKHMPKDAAEYVLDHSRRGDIFNRQFLFLPTDNIAETYSPQASLRQFLDNPHAEFDSVAIEAVQSTVQAFESFDIPLGSLSLYGSLQCGVSRNTPNAKMKDVDMLVRGVHNYDNLIALASEHPAPDIPLPLTVASDQARSLAVRRRRQIAQFAVPGVNGVHCDVRLVRVADDPNNYQSTAQIEPSPMATHGSIVDAHQSLSLPFAYQVSTQDTGETLWAVGNHYRSLGTAIVGDSVDVRGLKIADDIILVSHPTEDWIQPKA